MNCLALVTWRLPHAGLDEIEAARDATDPTPEAFRLATCQRVTLLASAENPAAWAESTAREAGVPGAERHLGPDAFRHLVRVTAALDAIAPGEDQVPAQVRRALDEQAEHLPGPVHRALQRVLAVAKTVRDEAGFAGAACRSLADRAVDALDDPARVTLVGTGQIAQAARQRLGERIAHVVSRRPERARDLAGPDAEAWTRQRFLDDPPAAEATLLCTRAPDEPILDPDAAARLADREAPHTVVDLGVPRNADPRAGDLVGLQLFDVEALARRPPPEGSILALAEAREALERALARERRRWARRDLDDRVVALREALAEDLDALVDELPDQLDDPPALDRWKDRAHARLAHAAQTHLLDALGGRQP